jgi:hypothetical protein
MSTEFFKNYQIDKDENHIYVIPKGTTIFRADSSVNKPTYKLEYVDGKIYPIFFGFDKESVEQNYGITYQFTTIEDIRCIAIDRLDEKSPFYVNSPYEIQKILLSNYGLKTKKRLSESVNDKILTNYICSLGYEGYAINTMDTQLGTFHSEIAVCNISNLVDPNGTRVTTQHLADKLHQEYILIKDKKEREETKKRIRRERYESRTQASPPQVSNKKSLFEDSPPSSPIKPMPISFSTPPRNNRGGSRKMKKTARRRKTNKRR